LQRIQCTIREISSYNTSREKQAETANYKVPVFDSRETHVAVTSTAYVLYNANINFYITAINAN